MKLKLKKNEIQQIYANSDKVYIIINLPNFKDNRIILAKINSFNVGDHNKIKNIFSREIYFFSEKNKLLKILLDKEINLNQFVIDIDPQIKNNFD